MRTLVAGSVVVLLCVSMYARHGAAQEGPVSKPSSWGTTTQLRPAPKVNPARATEWRGHNGDLRNSRYSPLNEITAANAGRLAVKWMFRPGQVIGSNGALVVDGLMYLSNSTTVFAVDAATGDPIWRFEHESQRTALHRGPGYGDGVVYAYSGGDKKSPAIVYAMDARTGELVKSFGDNGAADVVLKALQRRNPGKYPDTFNSSSLGYTMSTPPAYYNGTLFVATGLSDSLIPGGLLIAIDARTAAIKWVFNTVPQGPDDEGWELAKDTWVGGIRGGAGIWTTPAIDPDLGMIYFNAANAAPDYDGSARLGINLFTNTTIALDLNTGKLRWHFQTVHHDIWDYDTVAGPILFDTVVRGVTVKAVAAASKTGYLYIWNRATGQPLNPIKEVPVPTDTNVPGEQPWPTQPIPHTATGAPQKPFVPTLPTFTDPARQARVRPAFTPFRTDEAIIIAPAMYGGATYGGPSHSPVTRLVYVSGIVGIQSFKPTPLGNTATAGTGTIRGERDEPFPFTGTLTAYDPATGEQAWQTSLSAPAAAGSLTTAGNVIFQGTGSNYARTSKPLFQAFDARSGKPLFTLNTGALVTSEPVTYTIDGKQYVSVVSTDTVITLALP